MDEPTLLTEITNLKKKLLEKEAQLIDLRLQKKILQDNGLSNNEIARYSRQMLLQDIKVNGQVKLKTSSVLIVGAGGLGCPSALYLAGSGIGHIGIVDYDDVDISNLHRQVLFSGFDVGVSKAHAAKQFLQRFNENIKITAHFLQLNSNNAMEILAKYDLVIDATDNVATRYLLNDACVLSGKPLISGSALQFEGQLTVYNHFGPCYRCIFPKPPPPAAVNNCGDSGVLGAVVGTIGVLQALEAIKIILGLPGILSSQLLMFDGLDLTFRKLKLRPRNLDCAVCGNDPKISKLIDYEEFCGAKANDKNPNLLLLKANDRISVEDFNKLRKCSSKSYLLIDVRSPQEFEMCRLQDSTNIPLSKINNNQVLDELSLKIDNDGKNLKDIFVVCRRGNDSQKAVQILKSHFANIEIQVKDITGGLHAWTHKIDPVFPIY